MTPLSALAPWRPQTSSFLGIDFGGAPSYAALVHYYRGEVVAFHWLEGPSFLVGDTEAEEYFAGGMRGGRSNMMRARINRMVNPPVVVGDPRERWDGNR